MRGIARNSYAARRATKNRNSLSSKDQSLNTRAGSARVARHPGKKHAASVVTVITTNAAPNASGSRGLTL